MLLNITPGQNDLQQSILSWERVTGWGGGGGRQADWEQMTIAFVYYSTRPVQCPMR